MQTQLKTIKASAGSGKTYRLTVEYIKLLIENPTNYRHTLAVTFTKKATAEMKSRIISTLHGLANRLPAANGYMESLLDDPMVKALGYDSEKIREHAGKALSMIIHDYSHFRIETIDSYFQSVIRNLARELNLANSLRVEIKQDDALTEAVERIFDELEEGEPTYRALISFIDEKMQSGKNWAIKDETIEFGENLFKEDYLQCDEKTRHESTTFEKAETYKKKLKECKKKMLDEIHSLADNILEECKLHGWQQDDFKGKSRGLYTRIVKCRNVGTPGSDDKGILPSIEKDMQEPYNWAASADQQPSMESVLGEKLRKLNNLLTVNARLYTTIDIVLQNINSLVTLNIIDRMIRQINAEQNRFMLGETNHFLREMIDDSDVPFIYEKSGTTFKYIMIDEFQDTSAMQWANFLPMLRNSLDSGYRCLVVGDVKQSIYRFRNSDWKILNGIRNNESVKRFVDEETLETNYRSAGNIVQFNNEFFLNAAQVVNKDYHNMYGEDSEELQTAYDTLSEEHRGVMQRIKKGNHDRGFVQIVSLEEKTTDDLNESMKENTLKAVRTLMSKGVRQEDIAILLRWNRDIKALSLYLASNAPDLRLVSSEAFQLDSSPAVALIILAMKYLCDTRNRFNLNNLVYYWQMWVEQSDNAEQLLNEIFLAQEEDVIARLPECFRQSIETLQLKPTNEVAEQLYSLLSLGEIENQDGYLFAFHDRIEAFSETHSSDLAEFIAFWDESLHKKTITGGTQSGIHIMTVHKSKGLEFHSVIIPFCNYNTEKNASKNILWCKPENEPFNDMPILPISYSNKMAESLFSQNHETEHLMNLVDNLNTLYVAFTRARENLIIYKGAVEKKSKSKDGGDKHITNIEQIITASIPALMTDDGIFGKIVPSDESSSEKKQTSITGESIDTENAKFTHFISTQTFKQSNESQNFVGNGNEYIDKGLKLHNLLAEISTRKDIDRVFHRYESQGWLYEDGELATLRSKIESLLSQPYGKEWFSDKWTIHNESAIIINRKTDKIQRRPDRVLTDKDGNAIVIDYKTGERHNGHKNQVRRYMGYLRNIGYKNIKGYLWYIEEQENNVVEVFFK